MARGRAPGPTADVLLFTVYTAAFGQRAVLPARPAQAETICEMRTIPSGLSTTHAMETFQPAVAR